MQQEWKQQGFAMRWVISRVTSLYKIVEADTVDFKVGGIGAHNGNRVLADSGKSGRYRSHVTGAT